MVPDLDFERTGRCFKMINGLFYNIVLKHLCSKLGLGSQIAWGKMVTLQAISVTILAQVICVPLTTPTHPLLKEDALSN